MALPKTRITLDEFLRLPEEEPPLEYDDGRITQKVSPKLPHGRLQSKLVEWLNVFAEPRRLGLAFTETRAVFGGKSFVPDVMFIRWKRLPFTDGGGLPDDFSAAPDIAVEIISPGQTFSDLDGRCRWYAENGVGVALLLRPTRETIRLYRPGQPPIELRGQDVIDLGDVLPGFSLSVDQIFATLHPGRMR